MHFGFKKFCYALPYGIPYMGFIVRPIHHRLTVDTCVFDFPASGVSDVSAWSDNPHDIGHVYFSQVQRVESLLLLRFDGDAIGMSEDSRSYDDSAFQCGFSIRGLEVGLEARASAETDDQWPDKTLLISSRVGLSFAVHCFSNASLIFRDTCLAMGFRSSSS